MGEPKRIPLVSGGYQARSVLAGAQRCVNLYPESAPDPQAPVPVTHYPTPGLRLLMSSATKGPVRECYRATNGDLYTVVGPNVYYIAPGFVETLIGTITDKPTRAYMADNGQTIVLVDGTVNGYTIDMTTRAFAPIVSAAFFGGDRVDYIDTYFVFNRPGTRQWYKTNSQAVTFDPLDIAAKTGGADNIATVISIHRELWVIGELTSEVWVNSGAADFTFSQLPGAFIEHGCAAKYSVASQDISVFFLSQDTEGRGIVVQGTGYQVKRISTHAIEADIQSYATISDAIGYCFQQQGHAFYVLTFPTADKTWAYELATGQWHELAWTDDNGGLHRHRANSCCFAYGVNIIGDWQNGSLYALDPNVFTDNGRAVTRIRSFPHMISGGRQVSYQRFIADMQVGAQTGGQSSAPPMVTLRWSDTGGASWGDPITASMGATGEYRTQINFNRLGRARDRVFELSWTADVRTALLGAFVEREVSDN
jgi:hypothetical protein